MVAEVSKTVQFSGSFFNNFRIISGPWTDPEMDPQRHSKQDPETEPKMVRFPSIGAEDGAGRVMS